MTIVERPATTATEATIGVNDETPWGLASTMRVRKRDGTLEPVDVNKIVRAVGRAARGLDRVDLMRVATRTISGLHDGATTMDLDELSIRTAAALVSWAGIWPSPSSTHMYRSGSGSSTAMVSVMSTLFSIAATSRWLNASTRSRSARCRSVYSPRW